MKEAYRDNNNEHWLLGIFLNTFFLRSKLVRQYVTFLVDLAETGYSHNYCTTTRVLSD